jgi:hypothetical protein
VNRTGHLRRLARGWVLERVLGEERFLLDGLPIDDTVDLQLVLPLEVQVHEGLRRMKVDVARLITESAVGGDRLAIGHDAVLVAA